LVKLDKEVDVEKEDLILNLLKETRKDQKTTTKDISEMKIDVALNRQDLEEHMDQTRAVKQLALDIRTESNSRINSIEDKLTATHLLKLTVGFASGIGVISGAIYGVIRLLS